MMTEKSKRLLKIESLLSKPLYPDAEAFELPETLHLTAEGDVVAEDDPKGIQVLGGKGTRISKTVAGYVGLLEGETIVEDEDEAVTAQEQLKQLAAENDELKAKLAAIETKQPSVSDTKPKSK